MAAETAYVYQRPQRLTAACNLQRARRVVAGLLIALGVANSHLLWTFTLYYPSTGDDSGATAVCVDRLSDPRTSSANNMAAMTPFWNVMRMVSTGYRFAVLQVLPYFIVFSSAVMLVTKKLKRKDQLRQVKLYVQYYDPHAKHHQHRRTCGRSPD